MLKEKILAVRSESWDVLGCERSTSWILISRICRLYLKELTNWDSLRHAAVMQLVYKYTLRTMQPLS